MVPLQRVRGVLAFLCFTVLLGLTASVMAIQGGGETMSPVLTLFPILTATASVDDVDNGGVVPLPVPVQPGDSCIATVSGASIDLHSGPGTNYNVVQSVTAGDLLTAIGVNSGWYLVELQDDSEGWVAENTASLNGACDDLPFVPVPGAETPRTPTAEAGTATPSATVTFTPSWTPTSTATATFTPSYTPTTPPPDQVAPEDPRFNSPLEIPLDNTVSVLDFVSYPGGDTEDRVRYSVTGMNPDPTQSGGRARLVIAVSCFGENTDQIELFTGGQTFSCGQTLVDREVTADSDTGSIVITAVGGEGTYVQWVLTGTATRLN
jgi:hypothetical protein